MRSNQPDRIEAMASLGATAYDLGLMLIEATQNILELDQLLSFPKLGNPMRRHFDPSDFLLEFQLDLVQFPNAIIQIRCHLFDVGLPAVHDFHFLCDHLAYPTRRFSHSLDLDHRLRPDRAFREVWNNRNRFRQCVGWTIEGVPEQRIRLLDEVWCSKPWCS